MRDNGRACGSSKPTPLGWKCKEHSKQNRTRCTHLSSIRPAWQQGLNDVSCWYVVTRENVDGHLVGFVCETGNGDACELCVSKDPWANDAWTRTSYFWFEIRVVVARITIPWILFIWELVESLVWRFTYTTILWKLFIQELVEPRCGNVCVLWDYKTHSILVVPLSISQERADWRSDLNIGDAHVKR